MQYPSDTKNNRLRQAMDELIGIEDPDMLFGKIIELIKTTGTTSPSVDNYYTFLYDAKTSNIVYDEHPLVYVTEIFSWGFRGINLHWGDIRQYTTNQVVGPVYFVNEEELRDLETLPYKKIRGFGV
jgi:hypothetical protein|tara:strand:- start:2678 stop:3055 length:378 start_codon:yes stop_codon:yes gene_type:complete